MPTKSFSISEILRSLLTWDSSKLEVNQMAHLLPTDENGDISFSAREGRYREATTLEFPNAIISALIELYSLELSAGFEKDEDGVNLGTIDIQLSNDDGVSYLFWNGSWSVAGANDWNTEEEIQTNISTFPFTTLKQIRPKIRLSSSADAEHTPFLYGLDVHYELDFVPEEDVYRSLKSKLASELEIITEVGVGLASASDKFTANIDAYITQVIGVFNLTNDPGRLTNLFSSIEQTLLETNEDTGEESWLQEITMSVDQASNDEIIARIKVRIPVYIAPDSDYTIGTMPKIIVELGDHSEESDFRNDSPKIEKNKALLSARVRRQPITYRMPVTLLSYTPDELLAKEMNRAVGRILKGGRITSLATAEDLVIVDEDEFTSRNVIREDLSIKSFGFGVIYRDWLGDFVQTPIVETFETIVDYGGAS